MMGFERRRLIFRIIFALGFFALVYVLRAVNIEPAIGWTLIGVYVLIGIVLAVQHVYKGLL